MLNYSWKASPNRWGRPEFNASFSIGCGNGLQATVTITNDNREAAPRLRPRGVFRTRTHTRASSLMQRLSAGISNSCGYINQPASTVTHTPSARRAGRNSHYALEASLAAPRLSLAAECRVTGRLSVAGQWGRLSENLKAAAGQRPARPF